MSGTESRSLIVRPGAGLGRSADQPTGVLSRMTVGALAAIDSLRHDVAGYRFREPDYRQIQLWARALGLDASELVLKLDGARYKPSDLSFAENELSLQIIDGSIRRLIWDFDALPLATFEWVDGLQLVEICFKGDPPGGQGELQCSSPTVEILNCPDLGLKRLHLDGLNCLRELDCNSNRGVWFDLSHTPKLRKLNCCDCQLSSLELSGGPKLTVLWCGTNNITELDFSDVPTLTELACSDNPLTELDLTPVSLLEMLDACYSNIAQIKFGPTSALTKFFCFGAPLRSIDLKLLPNLIELWVELTEQTHLDLTDTPRLELLHFNGGTLESIDLSQSSCLTSLVCTRNKIKELDLSHTPELTELHCKGNLIKKLDLRATKLEDLRVDASVLVIR